MSEYLEGQLRRIERRVEALEKALGELVAAVQTSAEEPEDPVYESFRRFQRGADAATGRG